jgi:mono/diheme cytochrome c family protein
MGRGAPVAANASASEIYQQKCQFCHGPQGQGGRSAPALTASAGRSEADLHQVIHDGRNRMPAFAGQLSDAQIDKMVAWVHQLKR